VRQQRNLWLVQAGLWSGHSQWLKKHLLELSPRRGVDPQTEHSTMCTLVAGHAFRPQATVDRAIGVEALEMLIGMGCEDQVRRLVWALQIDLREGPDELQLLCALFACQQALAAGNHELLATYSRRMEGPLNRLWVREVTALQLEARYTLAHICAQLKHFDRAAAEAQRCTEAVADLRKLDRPWKLHQGVVQNAARLQMAALEKYIRFQKDPKAGERLEALLQAIQADTELFGAELASTAAYQRARLQIETSPPDEVVKWLSSIPPDHPDHVNALFDITSVRFRQWRAAEAQQRTAALEALTSAGKNYWRRPDRDQKPNPSQDLEVMLRLSEAVLETPQESLDQARVYLNQAERTLGKSEAASTVSARSVAAFHYLRMRLFERLHDQEQALVEARWIAQNGRGQPVEPYALAALCKSCDLTSLAKSEAALQQQALADHRRLLELIEQAAQRQKKSLFALPNAEAIAARHSQLALQLGAHQEAAATLDKLAAAFPQRVVYLRQAAQAHFGAKSFEQAAGYWSNLSQLLDEQQHGDQWYEAKLYLIECLTRFDAPAARQVFDQFQQLYAPGGKLRAQKWQRRFDELGRMLASQN
jgi:hypothetical protein